jgi:hypothetical protein
MPWFPKFSVEALLTVQVAAIVIETVNDDVAVAASGTSMEWTRQVAVTTAVRARRRFGVTHVRTRSLRK